MDRNEIVSTREGLIFENGAFHTEERTVVLEQIWRVTVNGQGAGSFDCSPVQMQDAAVGYLFLKGFISAEEEIAQLEILEEAGEIRATVQKREDLPRPAAQPLELEAARVLPLLSWLENNRERGVHSCALICGDQTVLRHDVSRGTAVDKAAGACLRQGIPTGDAVLVFSGRVPETIVNKCRQMGCRLIVACSGPTDLACREAEEAGITIATHAGNGRFCVYTHPERIV